MNLYVHGISFFFFAIITQILLYYSYESPFNCWSISTTTNLHTQPPFFTANTSGAITHNSYNNGSLLFSSVTTKLYYTLLYLTIIWFQLTEWNKSANV